MFGGESFRMGGQMRFETHSIVLSFNSLYWLIVDNLLLHTITPVLRYDYVHTPNDYTRGEIHDVDDLFKSERSRMRPFRRWGHAEKTEGANISRKTTRAAQTPTLPSLDWRAPIRASYVLSSAWRAGANACVWNAHEARLCLCKIVASCVLHIECVCVSFRMLIHCLGLHD